MTASNDNDEVRIAAAMGLIERFGEIPHSGFLTRVPWAMRFYVEQFLAIGKLCHLREPVELVRNCIVMSRKGAAFHGNRPPGPDLLALAELFELHAEEAAAYAAEWEADILRRFGVAQ